ncbi:unnamed protein product [Prunus armeniaca]
MYAGRRILAEAGSRWVLDPNRGDFGPNGYWVRGSPNLKNPRWVWGGDGIGVPIPKPNSKLYMFIFK